MNNQIPVEVIENRIIIIRGQKVLLDRDLAELYGVETKYLNRQVRRNQKRFPLEFMFQLSQKERNELVTIWHRFNTMKHASSLPYAFTEYGRVNKHGAKIQSLTRAIQFLLLPPEKPKRPMGFRVDRD